jgi:predicted enzyme related to lactoylglutathione lyase
VTVDDVDVSAATAEKAGGNVIVPPMDVLDVGRMAVVQDPIGAFVSLWQPLAHAGAGLVNEPGALCWNELVTRDPQPAKAFYAALFGWDAQTDQMGDGEYTMFNLGGRGIAGMLQMNDQWPEHVPPHWAVYFAVEDTDASCAQAAELGAHVVQPPTDIPDVGRFATLADPQGAVFSIIALAHGPI